MNIFDRMKKHLDDCDCDSHVLVMGNCTMKGSPGYFAKIRSRGGIKTLALGEADTVEGAMTAAFDKLEAPTTRKMPGM